MPNLYDFDRAEEDRVVNTRSSDLPHSFIYDRASRRMVCEKCAGVMNDCPPHCTTRPAGG